MNGSFTLDYFRNWYDYNISFGFQLLQSHIQETEELIIKGIEKYEKSVETEEIIYDEFHSTFTDYYLGVDSSTYSLDEIFKEYFPNLKRQSLFLMVCSYMEHELYKLCLDVQKNEQITFSVNDMSSRIGKIEKIKKYFTNTFIKNYDKKFEIEWKVFRNYYRIRNDLTHNFGKITLSNTELKLFISKQKFLSINHSNELIMDKGFPEEMFENLISLCKTIQDLIRKYYDTKHHQN